MIIYVLFQKVTLAQTKPSGRDVSWLKSGSTGRACILRPAALCLMSQLGLDPPVDPPPPEGPAQIQLTQVGYRPIQPHCLASLRFEIKGKFRSFLDPMDAVPKSARLTSAPGGWSPLWSCMQLLTSFQPTHCPTQALIFPNRRRKI